MTYRKRYSTDRRGFIIADAIVALALSAMLTGLMAYSSLTAQAAFDRAQSKEELLAIYDAHAAELPLLMPGAASDRSYGISSSSESVTISERAKWYGNDRIETDIQVSDVATSIAFTAVRSYPFSDPALSEGTALCSERFGKGISILPISIPVNASLPLTDLIVRDGIAYVSTDSSAASDPDLLVVDIHDDRHPIILSSINTGPGINAIALAGNHVFGAAASTAAQLHVIKMNSLSSLSLAKKYKLPLPESSTSPPMASSIFYDKGKVYIGTDKWDGPEFEVLDVSAPDSPAKIYGFETGSKVNSIYVWNGTAYVAASGESQLYSFDVTGSQPVLESSFSPAGWQRQEGKMVTAFEGSLSFGRTSGGFNISSDKELFSWNASGTMASTDIPGGVYGSIQDRDHIYATTRNVDKELSVFDRSLASTTAEYYSLPVAPQAMTCDGDTLYILAATAPYIYEIKSD